MEQSKKEECKTLEELQFEWGDSTVPKTLEQYIYDYFKEQLKGYEWISVEERLPEDMQTALVMSNTALSPTIAYFFRKDWMYYAINDSCFWISAQPHIKITHWQPLPTPPHP